MHSFVNRERGFTLLELLVTGTLLLILGGMTASSILVIKRLYSEDSARKQVNQSLRGTLDIIGTDIRVGGESLPMAFPAFQVADGGEGPDELVVRRSLISEVLKVCEKIQNNTAEPHVYFAVDFVTPGCIFGDNTHNFETWRAYRQSQGGLVRAYIFNLSSGLGEFFNYVDEDTTGHKYRIWRDGGKWENDYDVEASAVYLLEEWKYRVRDGVLEVVSGGDQSNSFKVMLDVVDFQISVGMNDGTTKTSFSSTDDWTSVRYVEVFLSALQRVGSRSMRRSLRSRFFPRNVLSF